MTDPIDPGVRPDATPPSPATWPPPADPAPPPFEAAEPGAIAPAQAVHRDDGAAFAARTGRSNVDWSLKPGKTDRTSATFWRWSPGRSRRYSPYWTTLSGM